jgi:hypothetical protein
MKLLSALQRDLLGAPGNTLERLGLQKPISDYVPGAVLENAWGYDQTNIEYYRIVKRSGLWVWLIHIGKKNVKETGDRCGTCEPDPKKELPLPTYLGGKDKLLKRKIHVWDGQEQGLSISTGWCSVWNGKPSCWSAYA